MKKPEAPISSEVPRSGCFMMNSTGIASSTAPMTWSENLVLSSRRAKYQASNMGTAIFMSSEGWMRTTPRCSQRRAPWLISPNSATPSSSNRPRI